jgi:hypothetical protein
MKYFICLEPWFEFCFQTREGKAAFICFIGSVLAAIIGAIIILIVQRNTIRLAEKREALHDKKKSYVDMLKPIFGELTYMFLNAPRERIDGFLQIHFLLSNHNLGPSILNAMSQRLSHYGRETFLSMAKKFRSEINNFNIDDVQILKLAIMHLVHIAPIKSNPYTGPYTVAIMDTWSEFLRETRQAPDTQFLSDQIRSIHFQIFGTQSWTIITQKLTHHTMNYIYGDIGDRLALIIFHILPDPNRDIAQETRIHKYKADAIIVNNNYDKKLLVYAELVAQIVDHDYAFRCEVACQKLINNYSLPIGDSILH